MDEEGKGVPCMREIDGRLTGEGESTVAGGGKDEGGDGSGGKWERELRFGGGRFKRRGKASDRRGALVAQPRWPNRRPAKRRRHPYGPMGGQAGVGKAG
jgi:hypothetical protein